MAFIGLLDAKPDFQLPSRADSMPGAEIPGWDRHDTLA
jgi:hypothetical protein